MNKLLIGLALVCLLIGCQGKLVPVPPFEVRIELDNKAEKELRERKETIHISGIFAGIPGKNSGLKENNKASGYVFGSFEKEIDISGKTLSVRFDNLQLPEKIINKLENKNYGLELSVRSGWKSSQFNLLSCDPPLSAESRRQYIIKCKFNPMWE